MSMSTYVVGIRPADETYRKMLAVWEACKTAKVRPPPEIVNFFAAIDPDPAGVVVHLEENVSIKEWKDDNAQGYEVDLRKLDPTIKILRFVNSW